MNESESEETHSIAVCAAFHQSQVSLHDVSPLGIVPKSPEYFKTTQTRTIVELDFRNVVAASWRDIAQEISVKYMQICVCVCFS